MQASGYKQSMAPSLFSEDGDVDIDDEVAQVRMRIGLVNHTYPTPDQIVCPCLTHLHSAPLAARCEVLEGGARGQHVEED